MFCFRSILRENANSEEEEACELYELTWDDSIVHIGKPEQPFLIPDPGVDVALPGSDEGWDQGVRQ